MSNLTVPTIHTITLQELPPPGNGSSTTDPAQILGIDTWSNLMRRIGRGVDVAESEGTLADRMLREWVRVHLLPKPGSQMPSAPPAEVKVGSVLVSTVSRQTGLPADRVLIHDQFLHKALLLVLAEGAPDAKLSVCVLNRPTANLVHFNLPGTPKTRVPFCGNRQLGSKVWLHHRADLGGVAVGDSGVFILPEAQVVEKMQTQEASAEDFFLVLSVVQIGRAELAGMLAAGEMRKVPPGPHLSGLWERAWSLTQDQDAEVSDGCELWWLASQCGAETNEKMAPAEPCELADQVLAEWIQFFARGK